MPETSLDANQAIEQLQNAIEGIISSSRRSVELRIQNKSGDKLYLDARVSGMSDGPGSGYWAPGDDPEAVIDDDNEEVAGLESNGAGACGLVVYRIGDYENPFHLFFYFACPLSTGNRIGIGAQSSPNLEGKSSSEWQTIANSYFETMDANYVKQDLIVIPPDFPINPYKITGTFSGNSEMVATFTVERVSE